MHQAFQVLMSRLPSADNGPRPKKERTSLHSEDTTFWVDKINKFSISVKYLPDFNIRVLLERVDVASDRTFKEHGLLRNDAESRPQIMES